MACRLSTAHAAPAQRRRRDVLILCQKLSPSKPDHDAQEHNQALLATRSARYTQTFNDSSPARRFQDFLRVSSAHGFFKAQNLISTPQPHWILAYHPLSPDGTPCFFDQRILISLFPQNGHGFKSGTTLFLLASPAYHFPFRDRCAAADADVRRADVYSLIHMALPPVAAKTKSPA